MSANLTSVVGMCKHWDWHFPELVGFIACLTSLSCYCTLCFGRLVSVMVWVVVVVVVVWTTISTRKSEIQRTVSFLDVTAVQSINKAFDVVDTKYSTNKTMALCHLSGWFYINSNIKGHEGPLWVRLFLTLVIFNQLVFIKGGQTWSISDQNIWNKFNSPAEWIKAEYGDSNTVFG